MTPPPSRKGRPSAISSIGLTGAPSAAASVASPAESPQVEDLRRQDAETSRRQDAETSRRQDIETPRRRDASTASPGDGTVAFTLRLTADEALDLDELQLDFRRALRRRVDKAGIFRTLLVLAADDPDLRKRVADQLRNG